MPWVLGLVVVLGAAVPTGQPESTPSLTPAEGRRLAETLDAIVGYSGTPGSPARTSVLTERGINAYLRFQGADLLPPAVGEPRMLLLGDGRLSARALIDLDLLRDGTAAGAARSPALPRGPG